MELWEQCIDYTTEVKTKKGNALCIAFLSFIRLALSGFKLRVLKARIAQKSNYPTWALIRFNNWGLG